MLRDPLGGCAWFAGPVYGMIQACQEMVWLKESSRQTETSFYALAILEQIYQEDFVLVVWEQLV